MNSYFLIPVLGAYHSLMCFYHCYKHHCLFPMLANPPYSSQYLTYTSIAHAPLGLFFGNYHILAIEYY